MEVLIEGLKINYYTLGKGEEILLLHGWGGSLESWYPIIKQLGQNYKIVALDLPGFGRSEFPSNSIGVYDYSRIVAGFINKIKLKKAIVVGHSFGGSISLVLASLYPSIIRGIILVDSAGIRESNIKKTVIYLLAKTGRGVFSLPILSNFYDKARNFLYKKIDQNDYLDSGNLKESYNKIIKEDLRPILPAIKKPTLIIWGENDKDTPLSDAKEFNDSIVDSKLIIIPKSGHFSYLDNPILFNDNVRKFIKELKQAGN